MKLKFQRYDNPVGPDRVMVHYYRDAWTYPVNDFLGLGYREPGYYYLGLVKAEVFARRSAWLRLK
jgi:hypothetical protein